MGDLWLPGFERVERHPQAYPGTFLPGVPRRKVAHSTEFYSRNPASIASRHANPPHLWVTLPSHPYAPRRKIQIYPLNVAARALHHPPGTPETNKMGAIQTEIEGKAADLHRLSTEDLDWLADEVWGPACRATGVDVSQFIAGVGDVNKAYGTRARTRMSAAQWRTFNGLCSHQNVPDNDHWDAGGLDLAYISRRLQGANVPAAKPEPRKDPHMATRQIFQTGPDLSLMAEVSVAGYGIAAIRTQTEANGMFSGWFPLHTDADPQPFGAVEVTAGTNADGRQEIVVYAEDGRCARKVRNTQGGWKPWAVEGQ